jgi:hypothetical protein
MLKLVRQDIGRAAQLRPVQEIGCTLSRRPLSDSPSLRSAGCSNESRAGYRRLASRRPCKRTALRDRKAGRDQQALLLQSTKITRACPALRRRRQPSSRGAEVLRN